MVYHAYFNICISYGIYCISTPKVYHTHNRERESTLGDIETFIYMMSSEFNSISLILAVLFTSSLGKLVVDRSNERLMAIPGNIDPGVTTLKLNKNFIRRVEDGDMGRMFLLEELYLKDNGVTFISTEAFVNNTYLVLLIFTGHRFLSIPAELGGAWRSLQRIGCAGGYAGDMQPLTLAYLPTLVKLDANKNPVHKMILGRLPSLKQLSASNCKLETFPNLSAAPALEKVTLTGNYFTTIPPYTLTGLNKIRILNLNDGQIQYLPNLSHLTSLKTLLLRHNSLTSLPDLYHLTLTHISLFGNPLTCNKALCWVRMWSFIRTALAMANPSLCGCAAPPQSNGLRLMDIHPVDLECYEGKRVINYFPFLVVL